MLRYQRRPKRHARGPSACMVSASSGTLFSGAAGKGTGRLPARSGGTPWHRRWWHAGAVPGEWRAGGGVQVPGHCLQQSEGLARTGLAQVSRGHCTFSQCTSPVVPCGERRRLRGGTGQSVQVTHPPPWFEPLLQCLAAEGSHHGCQGSHHGCQGSSAAKPGSGSWGGLGPTLTLQVQMAHLMRPKGGTTGCQRVPEPRHVLSPSK